MIAETIGITETPCTEAGRCFEPGCELPARVHVFAMGACIRASTFACHGHVQDGHAKVLRMFAQVLEDNLAEARGEFEPVTL